MSMEIDISGVEDIMGYSGRSKGAIKEYIFNQFHKRYIALRYIKPLKNIPTCLRVRPVNRKNKSPRVGAAQW